MLFQKENADNVTKTFSAFANSDGRIVVYSVAEDNHMSVNTLL